MKMKVKRIWCCGRKAIQIEAAYFTAEAAFIMPIVFGTLLFMVYLFLYQYDRCLLEQDIGAMALWGSLVEVSDTIELEQKTQERMAGLYKEKYVAWRITHLEASLDRNRFLV